jgi:hypothetical protein
MDALTGWESSLEIDNAIVFGMEKFAIVIFVRLIENRLGLTPSVITAIPFASKNWVRRALGKKPNL